VSGFKAPSDRALPEPGGPLLPSFGEGFGGGGAGTARDLVATGPLAHYPGPALVLSPDGAVLAANLPGSALAAAIAPRLPPDLAKALESVRSGQAADFAFSLTVGGRPAHFRASLMPGGDGTGLLLARDIAAERERLNRTLSITLSLRHLLEMASDFAWETDEAGKFAFISPRRVLGYKAETLVGKAPAEIFGKTPILDIVKVFGARAPVRDVPIRGYSAEGRAVNLRAQAAPILDPNGGWRGARGVLAFATAEDAKQSQAADAPDHAAAIAELMKLVRDADSLEEALTTFAEVALDALDGAGLAVYRWDERERLFHRLKTLGRAGSDAEARPYLERLAGAEEQVDGRHSGRPLIACRTRNRDQLTGALVVWRGQIDDPWSAAERGFVTEAARLLSLSLKFMSDGRGAAEPARPAGLASLEAVEDARAGRWGRNVPGREGSLICIDMANLGALEAARGEGKANELSKMFAMVLLRLIGGDGIACQPRRDRFLVWLDEGGEKAATRLAGTLLQAMSSLGLPQGGSLEDAVSLSIGIYVDEESRALDFDEIARLAAAGASLARKAGGNRHAFA